MGMEKKSTGKNRALLLLGIAMIVCVTCGVVLRYWAGVMDTRRAQYAEAVQTVGKAVAAYRSGDVAETTALAQQLEKILAVHKGEEKWEALHPYQQLAEGLAAYGVAEAMLDRHRNISSQKSGESPPDPKEILEAYTKFEQNFRAVMGKGPFAAPELMWRMENDLATAQVWQMAVKLALQDAKPEDVQPLFEAAITGYKRALLHAEKVSVSPQDTISNPVRFISQNLDFVTRLTEQQDQQKEKKPQSGMGNMLQRGNQPADKFLLPMPMPSIGHSRIEGGKK